MAGLAHEIERAALNAGFIAAKPATAHPFELWREILDGLPLGKRMTMEHRPEAVCGWPVRETTVWAALYPAPPFGEWPADYGEVSGYYISSNTASGKIKLWEAAVRDMGYETLARPRLPARPAAIRAGLGVHGLNGLLITPYGSFVYIAVMLVHTPPPEGTPGPEADFSPGCERCGVCRTACPSGAISEHGLDALKCLSNSISHPSFASERHYPLMGNRIRGCDACQRVCPHNACVKHLRPDSEQTEPFALENLLDTPDLETIGRLIGKNYAKESRLHTQAALAAANTGRTDLIPILRRHLDSDYEPLRKAAAWALARLEG